MYLRLKLYSIHVSSPMASNTVMHAQQLSFEFEGMPAAVGKLLTPLVPAEPGFSISDLSASAKNMKPV